jgi:hypothetical protein
VFTAGKRVADRPDFGGELENSKDGLPVFLALHDDLGHICRAQVPNPLQRTLKPYVDWDMKLSTVEESQFFESFAEIDWIAFKKQHEHVDSKYDDPGVPWRVNFVRHLGMCVPVVVGMMLKDMGCIDACADLCVLVKEGTLATVNKDGDGDWKISFHFIFQITVSLTQFKCLYEMITSYIVRCPSGEEGYIANAKDLGFLLGQVSLQQYEAYYLAGADVQSSRQCSRKAKALKSRHEGERVKCEEDDDGGDDDGGACRQWRDEASLKNYAMLRVLQGSWKNATENPSLCTSALVGMDMHPSRNAEQGLACLGSKKPGVLVGNRLLGMAQVQFGEGVTIRCLWAEDYCTKTHQLLAATKCSILAPGPRCIALEPVRNWNPFPWELKPSHLRGSKSVVAEREGVHGALTSSNDDPSVQACLRRVLRAEENAMGLCRGLRSSSQHNKNRCMYPFSVGTK